ncbi:Protein of unknown function [Gryllus bimaculatus]|nr:Protein of unknown function [Gryllus bimaculatus]
MEQLMLLSFQVNFVVTASSARGQQEESPTIPNCALLGRPAALSSSSTFDPPTKEMALGSTNKKTVRMITCLRERAAVTNMDGTVYLYTITP